MDALQTRSFLDSLLGKPAAEGQDWLKALRSRALERANVLAVPSPRDEEWRFTDLTPLYQASLGAAADVGPDPDRDALARFAVPEASATLVFVDGRYCAGLSSVRAASGLIVGNFSAVAVELPDSVEHWVGNAAPFLHDLFTAVNTARLRDGAVIHAARDVSAGPVHCLFVATRKDVAVHPRVFVRADSGADVTVIEDYVSLQDGAYCVNAVSEVFVAAHARVRHVRLQRDSTRAFHMANTGVSVGRDGRYSNCSVALGARISRHTLSVEQTGPGTEFELDGLALIAGRQLADTHSFVDHAQPNGTSRQQHKCVVAGGAHAVFNGRILVREGAQQTNSAQESRNLLLSDKAHVDTKPQLEIFADDVKCAHGAAVGQLEAEEVFYLRSRGLSEAAARGLLTYGFAADVVDRIPVPSLVAALHRIIVNQTGGPQLG